MSSFRLLLLVALVISNQVVAFCPACDISKKDERKLHNDIIQQRFPLPLSDTRGGQAAMDGGDEEENQAPPAAVCIDNGVFEENLPFNWTRVGEVCLGTAKLNVKIAIPLVLASTFLLGPGHLKQSLRGMVTAPINVQKTLMNDIPIFFGLNLLVIPNLVHRFVNNTHSDHLHKLSATMMGTKFRPLQVLLAGSAIGLVSGVLEEFVFRGILQSALVELLGRRNLAVWIQAAFFGSVHYNTSKSVSMVLQTTLSGLVYSTLYVVRGNIGVPMMAHAWWNTCVLFLSTVMYFFGTPKVHIQTNRDLGS